MAVMEQPYDQAELEALVALGLIQVSAFSDSREPSYVFEPRKFGTLANADPREQA
jgi:hypothetical protein